MPQHSKLHTLLQMLQELLLETQGVKLYSIKVRQELVAYEPGRNHGVKNKIL